MCLRYVDTARHVVETTDNETVPITDYVMEDGTVIGPQAYGEHPELFEAIVAGPYKDKWLVIHRKHLEPVRLN